MAKVTLNDLSKALGLNEKEPKKDFHYYGTIVDSNPIDNTYQVSINRDTNISVEAARLVGAGIGDTVMVTVMSNGYATVTNRLGGDLDATNAQRAADAAADTASTAQGVANSALTNAQQANQTANAARTLAEHAEEEAGRAHTAAEQAASDASSAATSAQNAEQSASSAATSASNAESSASSAATSASNAETSASRASTAATNAESSASRASTAAQNAEADASSAATSASNAESSASRAATSASNAESSASRASTAATNAESDAASAAESAQNAADDAATASSQASAATTAANEAKAQAQDAETAANEAKSDANDAKRDAASANAAANGAVASLAITQGVVDQLGQDMDDMQTHVAMMDAVGDIPAGLHVVPSSGGYFMVIANDGVYVYDNESVLVAKYGHDISFDSNREHKIGNNTNYIRYYDSNNDGVADSIEIVANNIRLGSYSVADKIAEAKKAGTDAASALNTYKTSNDARVKAVEDGLSSTDEDLANYITSQADVIDDLQNQIDGAIDTWYYSGDPTLSNQPAVSWTTDETKENHLRDLYFNTQNGHSFRFAKEGNTYKWIQIQDADAIKALADAAAAQGTANVKKRVFVAQPAPPYDIGDLWVQGSTGDIKRCATAKMSSQSFEAADWVLASKYTDDTKANAVESDLHMNYYVKSDFSVAPDKIASTITASETSAKTYADGKAATAETNAKAYADGVAEDVQDDLDDYKTTVTSTYATKTALTQTENTLEGKITAAETRSTEYADGLIDQEVIDRNAAISASADSITSTVSSTYATKTSVPTKVSQLTNDSGYQNSSQVNTIAGNKASAALSDAKTYADNNFDGKGSAASALSDAKDYADNNFDGKGSAASALSDAKDYADDNFDSKGSASAAQAAAISAAAADATSKANAAESNAKADTTNKLKSYYTKTQTDSAITQKADNILSTVSTTYQTKADMDDYSTTAEMNSAIDQKADSITSTVSQTYATKTQAQGYANTAESNAKTAAATDATNKANAAKADAISTASTDATNKANAAKQAAINDAASKYYNKTETYTKSEIEQKAGEISLSVAQEEVEKIEIGGRNLFAIAGSVPGYLNYDGSGILPQQFKERTTDYIPVDPNSKYCLQAWYDLTNPTSSYEWVCVQYYTSEKERITQPIRYHMTDVNYKEWILTLTSDTAYVRISSRWVEPGYEYAKVKFEKGNKFTDWTPAPEDLENYTDTKITEAKAAIKVTTDAIETTVSNKVGNSEIISKINQSAESVKIQASKVEIDGTATFNAIKSQTDAAYDAKGAAAAKKSIHTLDSSYSQTYAQLLTWSKENYDAGQWAVSSTVGVAIGDTVRIKCTVSDMNNAAVYVLGTVTAVESATILRMKSHGLDTTIIDGGNILANSITADQIKGNTLTLGQISTEAQSEILNSNVDVPTKMSDLTNDSGYQTASQVESTVTNKGYQTASQVEATVTGKGYQTSSQVETAITNKGYQTSSQVETAITNKGYQTSSQVESAITSKGYQNATQVSNTATAKADDAAWSVELETTSIDLLNNKATIKATVYKYGVKQTSGFTRAWYKNGSVISGQTGESIADVTADALYTCVIT